MANVVKLEWASDPTFEPRAIGEPADYTGKQVNVLYDNGTRDTIDVTFKLFNESNLQMSGETRTSYVSYGGVKLPASIPLLNTRLDYIEAFTKPAFVAREGEVLHLEDIAVIAHFTDGSAREVHNYKYFPYVPLQSTDKEVSIRYGRCRTIIDIVVQPAPEAPAAEEPALPPAEPQVVPEDDELLSSADPMPSKTPQEAAGEPSEKSDAGYQPPTGVDSGPSGAAVDVQKRTVVSVTVAQRPNKQKYLVGATMPDLSGGLLSVTYSDGSAEKVAMQADGHVNIKSATPGRGMVTFEYCGIPVGYSIEVVAPKVERLRIDTMPIKRNYVDGEELDLSGLVLEVTYNDGSTRMVRDLQGHGMQVHTYHSIDGVSLSYEDIAFTIPVQVEKKAKQAVLLSAMLCSVPSKMMYVEREAAEPDLTGAQLLLQYSDGQRKQIDVLPGMIHSFDISKPGSTMMEIRYEGLTVVCPILVTPRTLVSIEIGSPPRKTAYSAGEQYNMMGLIIFACYNNGEKEPVAEYEVDKEVAKEGDSSLTFTYQGLTATLPVTVGEAQTLSVEWSHMPTKIRYFQNEPEVSCDGGEIAIVKSDGSKQLFPLLPSMVTGFDTREPGPSTVSVRVGEYTLSYNIWVADRVLLGIKITKAPKSRYHVGESFDASGLVVTAVYAGGTTEDVEVEISPNKLLTEKDRQMMFVYKDKAVMFPITVEPLDDEVVLDWSSGADVVDEADGEPAIQGEPAEAIEQAPAEEAPMEVMIPPFYPSSFTMRFLEE